MRIRRKIPASRIMKDGQHALVRNNEVVMIADTIDDLFKFQQPNDKVLLYRDGKFWKLTLSYEIDKNGQHFNVHGAGIEYES